MVLVDVECRTTDVVTSGVHFLKTSGLYKRAGSLRMSAGVVSRRSDYDVVITMRLSFASDARVPSSIRRISIPGMMLVAIESGVCYSWDQF